MLEELVPEEPQLLDFDNAEYIESARSLRLSLTAAGIIDYGAKYPNQTPFSRNISQEINNRLKTTRQRGSPN